MLDEGIPAGGDERDLARRHGGRVGAGGEGIGCLNCKLSIEAVELSTAGAAIKSDDEWFCLVSWCPAAQALSRAHWLGPFFLLGSGGGCTGGSPWEPWLSLYVW